MPNDKHIADRFEDIAALMADAKKWAKFDPRLDAHLAGYLCVLLTGAIEDAIERMVSLRVGSLGDRQIENYIIKVIAQRFRNPGWSAINGLLGEFSDEYKREWSHRFPPGDRVDESLQSIIRIKNTLAHTGTMILYVTLRDVQTYYDEVLPAVDELERILVGSP